MLNFSGIFFFGDKIYEHKNEKGFNSSISLGKEQGYVNVTYFGKTRPTPNKMHFILGTLVTQKSERIDELTGETTNQYNSKIMISMFKKIKDARIFDGINNDEIVSKLETNQDE